MEDEKKIIICRVCINQIEDGDKCFDIYEKHEDILIPGKYHDDILIATKISACADIKIEEGDGLPSRICSSCLLELEDAYNFKRKCEKSDHVLRVAVSLGSQDEVFIKENDSEQEFENESSGGLSVSEYNGDTHLEHQELPDEIDLKPDIEYEQTNDDPTNQQPTSLTPDKPINHKTSQPPYQPVLQRDENKDQVKKSKAIDLKLECDECGNFFKSKCKMQVHWKKVHYMFMCPSCKQQFKTYKAYCNHQKTKNRFCLNASKVRIEGKGKLSVFYCKECKYSTKGKSNMVNHFVIHANEHPFSCDFCDKSFPIASRLRTHREIYHKQFTEQNTCHICGLIVFGRASFKRHIRKHKQMQQVQCDICKKFYASKTILICHMKIHSGVKNYSCDKCDRKFYTSSNLCAHKKKHGAQQTYNCKICMFKSINLYVIKRHEKRHNPANVACCFCGKFLENDLQLTLHKKRHEDRRHQCKDCKKTFYSKKSLYRHKQVHNKESISIKHKASEL